MAVNKRFLDSAGAKYLVDKIQMIMDQKMSEDEILALFDEKLVPASAAEAGVVKVGSGLSINEDGVLSANVQSLDFENLNNVPTTLEGYGITDAASKDELNEMRAAVTNVYHFRGAVADRDALAAIENPEEGDVYNITSDGMNAAWVQPAGGEGFWDEFGSTVDLSDYVKEEDIKSILNEEIDAMFMKYIPIDVADLTSLKKAFATSGDTINVKLTEPMTADASLVVPAGKVAKIDLNGQTLDMGAAMLYAYGDMVIDGDGAITGTSRPVVANGGNITLKSGHVTSTNDCAITALNGGVVEMLDGEVTAQEVGIIGTTGATITVKGGKIQGLDNFAVGGNGNEGQGGTTINIEGGTLIGNIQSAGYEACAIYHPNSGTLNISGGTIIANGGCGVLMRGGELNMTGGSIAATGTEGTTGWVGDKKTQMNLSGIIYDYNANYPAKDTLSVNVTGGVVSGVDADIQIYSSEETPKVNVTTGANVVRE